MHKAAKAQVFDCIFKRLVPSSGNQEPGKKIVFEEIMTVDNETTGEELKHVLQDNGIHVYGYTTV